jgi:hypothetical protein
MPRPSANPRAARRATRGRAHRPHRAPRRGRQADRDRPLRLSASARSWHSRDGRDISFEDPAAQPGAGTPSRPPSRSMFSGPSEPRAAGASIARASTMADRGRLARRASPCARRGLRRPSRAATIRRLPPSSATATPVDGAERAEAARSCPSPESPDMLFNRRKSVHIQDGNLNTLVDQSTWLPRSPTAASPSASRKEPALRRHPRRQPAGHAPARNCVLVDRARSRWSRAGRPRAELLVVARSPSPAAAAGELLVAIRRRSPRVRRHRLRPRRDPAGLARPGAHVPRRRSPQALEPDTAANNMVEPGPG